MTHILSLETEAKPDVADFFAQDVAACCDVEEPRMRAHLLRVQVGGDRRRPNGGDVGARHRGNGSEPGVDRRNPDDGNRPGERRNGPGMGQRQEQSRKHPSALRAGLN